MAGPPARETSFSVCLLSSVQPGPFLCHTGPLLPSRGALCMGYAGEIANLQVHVYGVDKIEQCVDTMYST